MYKKYQILLVFALLSTTFFGQSSLVGRVINDKGVPLLGVDVILVNTTLGAASDESGAFKISNVPLGNYMVEVSSLGYKTQTIPVTFKNNIPISLKITLVETDESLSEVVVRAKTKQARKREEPIKIEVIDVEKIIEQSTSIPEIINQTSGVKVRQSSGIGSATTININGLQGNAIRYFKDGIPTDYLGRAFNIGLVPTSVIKNVEIYKGVLPIELGADALGGAINIVTKDKDKQYIDTSLELGSFNTQILNFNSNFIIPKTKIHVGVSSYHTRSDNDYEFDIDINTQGTVERFRVRRFHDAISASFTEANAGVHNTKIADVLDLKFAYFELDNEVQNGISIDRPFGEVTQAEINRIVSLQYEKKILPHWNIGLFAALSNISTKEQDLSDFLYNWFGEQTFPTVGGEFQKRDQRIQEDTQVARFNTQYDITKNVNVKLSSTYTSTDRVGSDPFGEVNIVTGIQPITIPSTYTKIISGLGIGASFFNKRVVSESFVKHYYLETEAASSSFSNNVTDELFNRSFGWGQSFKVAIDNDTYARISFENATRIPNADEYFGDNLFLLPNPLLEPETSDNLNVGFATNVNASKTLFIEVNTFYRNTKDFIRIFPQGLINSINRNSDTQITKGIEGNVRVKIDDKSSISAAITYQDLRRTETSGTDVILEDSRTPNIPYYFTNVTANKVFSTPLKLPLDLNVYGNYLYTEQYFVEATPKIFEPDLFGEISSAISSVIPTQHQVNLGFTCKFRNVPLSLNVEAINVFNNELFDDFRIPKPPRNYRLKLTYRLQ